MQTFLENEFGTAQAKGEEMGKVVVEVELISSDDEAKCAEGTLRPDQVRRLKMPLLVDTGCTLLSIPKVEIDRLGLRVVKEVQSRFANGQSAMRKIYGPVVIKLQGRVDIVLAMEGHPGMPGLLGQIPLEGLDLMVDSKRQRLVPGHPDFPDVQLVEVY